MKNKIELSVSFVGSGNLATALATLFYKKGVKVNAIYSLHKNNAQALCFKCGAKYSKIDSIGDSAEVIIVAVNDGSIEEVSRKIKGSSLIVHTSGSMPMSCLQNERIGVFYPLLSFDKNSIPEKEQIPIFLESSMKKDLVILKSLAGNISSQVIELNSSKRLYYHLAAVISQNFSNYLYGLSEDILRDQGLSFTYLIPLLRNHLDKLEGNSAKKIQTGPASRNDVKTLKKHLQILKKSPELQKIYRDFSANILKSRKK